MAAALTKNGLHNAYSHHHSLQYLWKRSIKHSIPNPVSYRNNVGYQLHQYKCYSRFPHSIFRKTKEMELSATSIISSSFCSRASSFSSKFGIVSWYLGMVKTRPIATKSITSSLIYTAADFSSQTIVGDTSERYDFLRTLRMAGYGMLILGPSLHFWFNFVSRAFPKRDLLSTIKKMVLGQTVYGPVMTATFFSVNSGLQGESGSEIVARLNRDLVPTMVSGIMYWPICDFVTFKFIPVHLQPLIDSPGWGSAMILRSKLTKYLSINNLVLPKQ